MLNRKLGVRTISTKEILVLLLLMLVSFRNVNGMIGFHLVATEDSRDNNDDKFFFSPLGGTSKRIPADHRHDKAIIDDVSLLHLLNTIPQ